MGQIADIISKEVYLKNISFVPIDDCPSEDVNKAELAIKKSLAKPGREMIKEAEDIRKKNMIGEGEKAYEYLRGRIDGVKELLARIKKL
jgi:hypothetical protein